MLVPAFPAVLRAGLPVICDIEPDSGRLCDVRLDVPAVVISLYGMDVEPDPWLTVGTDDRGRCGEREEVLVRHARLDLRDPAVWDAALRALERNLDAKSGHPTPAPMNCPAFVNGFLGFTLLVGDASYGLNAMANKGAAIRGDVYDPDATDEDVTLRGLACALVAVFA